MFRPDGRRDDLAFQFTDFVFTGLLGDQKQTFGAA